MVAEAPTSFKEGIGKFNPKLFNIYEKESKSVTSMARNRKSLMTSNGFMSKKLSIEKDPQNEYSDLHSKKMFNLGSSKMSYRNSSSMAT